MYNVINAKKLFRNKVTVTIELPACIAFILSQRNGYFTSYSTLLKSTSNM